MADSQDAHGIREIACRRQICSQADTLVLFSEFLATRRIARRQHWQLREYCVDGT